MRIVRFIERDMEQILREWDEFARTLFPEGAALGADELRDSAEEILRAVIADMDTHQSEQERRVKSLGRAREGGGEGLRSTANHHAAHRWLHGFTLDQLIAEYRALRASVVSRWRAHLGRFGEAEVEELTRFNEAMDESLTRSVSWYSSLLEDARDTLNGVLAHDLKSPLWAMILTAEAMAHEADLDHRQWERLRKIRDGGERVREMIGDLLDFTRTRLGTGLPLEKRQVDLGVLLEEVAGESRDARPDSGVELERHGDLTGVWDLERLRQVLSNLLANAARHAAPGTPVRLDATGHDGSVLLQVHNRGEPIPPEQQRIIFDPLRRATVHAEEEAAEDVYRLGLGLYIVRQIVEAHDGRITVRSSRDDGTTFEVHLPRRGREHSSTVGLV